MKLKKLSNRGMTLPMVLMVFVVVMVLGTALLQISSGDARQAIWQNNKIQAHYLGRSGVYHGLQMVENKLAAETFTGTIADFAAELQATVTNPYTVPDVGTYDITFSEGLYSGQIKITSVGNTLGQFPGNITVSYTKDMEMLYSGFNDSPLGWLTGINLEKGINPDFDPEDSYLGHAVLIESKNSKNNIQSPKGSSNPSTFQASVIVIRDYEGRSLRQVTNSIDMTFDTEIIFFLGDIKLNKTNEPIVLSVSDDVLKQRTYNYNPSYPKAPDFLDYGPDSAPSPVPDPNPYLAGFEDYGRYYAFVYGYPLPEPLPADGRIQSVSFIPGETYGIVKLGGGIKDDDENIVFDPDTSKGYYYFKSGVDLQNSSDYTDFISIADDDPIVAILDSLIGLKVSSEEPFWSND